MEEQIVFIDQLQLDDDRYRDSLVALTEHEMWPWVEQVIQALMMESQVALTNFNNDENSLRFHQGVVAGLNDLTNFIGDQSVKGSGEEEQDA